ncbi:putative receptor protein kinase ZmPK1 isoform X2 [Fagus crenata]
MVTGKNTIMGVHDIDVGVEAEHKRLVTWVRETKNGKVGIASWIEHIIDPKMEGRYDMGKMEILAEVALQCVEEDKDARPTMSQVVEMLLRHENDHH